MRTVSIFATDKEYARIISRALGRNAYQYTVKGIPVYEVERNRVLYKITHLSGHIMGYFYPIKDLSNVSHTDLLNVDPIKAIDRSGDEASLVKAIVPKSDMVIAATENNAEGDSLALEVAKLISKERYNIPTKRLRCNTFSYSDILNGIYNLEPIDLEAAQGYNALAKLDFMYNSVLTKQLSNYIPKVHLENTGYIPISSCQTPLLGIIWKREQEIEENKGIDEWEVIAKVKDGSEQRIILESTENPILEKKKAKGIRNKLYRKIRKDGLKAVVQFVEEEKVKIEPPEPLNLPILISECKKIFDYEPGRTVKAIKELYQRGYISYPFTLEQEYPHDFDFTMPLLEWTSRVKRYTLACGRILDNGITVEGTSPRKSTPIYPRRPLALKHDRNPVLQSVFSVVMRHYLATLSDPLVVKRQIVSFSLEDDSFQCVSATVEDRGWTWPYVWEIENFRYPLECKQGDTFDVESVKAKMTNQKVKPISSLDLYTTVYENAGRYIEDSIEMSIKNGLIERSKSYLKLTEFGRDLVQTLDHNAQILLNFTTRQHLLNLSQDVISKRMSYDSAITEGKEFIQLISKSLAVREHELREGLEKCLVNRDYQVIGKCPECGKALLIRQHTKPDGLTSRFVGCIGYPNCTASYSLPQKGGIEIGGICLDTSLPFLNVKTEGNKKNYKWGIGKGPCFVCRVAECTNNSKNSNEGMSGSVGDEDSVLA